jgi:mono/diheme cytochrome c family protein
MRTLSRLVPLTLVVAGLILEPLGPAAYAQQTRTANDRIYTDAQSARGRKLYAEKCATCHGDALEGKAAPALAGSGFLAVWGTQPLSELAGKIRNTMPATDPGKLTPSETADLIAYILQAGKFPAGPKDLSADQADLKSIVIAATKPQTNTAVSTQAAAFPAMGNLNQVMRGILFPSSNIIFNVQTNDPGAPRKPPASGGGNTAPFSWVDWGAGIYTGWQIVDYAAVAITESAPLMLTPGRRCENGRPVPVDRPDWIKFSQELAEVGRIVYRASQMRNQEAVSDASNQLADACLNCHQVYRDKRGFRPGDPAALAARCTP